MPYVVLKAELELQPNILSHVISVILGNEKGRYEMILTKGKQSIIGL